MSVAYVHILAPHLENVCNRFQQTQFLDILVGAAQIHYNQYWKETLVHFLYQMLSWQFDIVQDLHVLCIVT